MHTKSDPGAKSPAASGAENATVFGDLMAKLIRDLSKRFPAVRASLKLGRVGIEFGFSSENLVHPVQE